jgi:hypothetical protein
MNKTNLQPLSKRLQDIALYGVFFAVVSLLAGALPILFVTVPAFLLVSAFLATGRYKHSKPKRKNYLQNYQEKQKQIFCGCRDIYTRQKIHGY